MEGHGEPDVDQNYGIVYVFFFFPGDTALIQNQYKIWWVTGTKIYLSACC